MILRKKKYIYIFGTGGLANVVSEIVNNNKDFTIKAYIDDRPIKKFNNKKVYKLSNFIDEFENEEIVIAIGENIKRKIIYEKLNLKKFKFPNIIDRSAVLSSSTKLGRGNIILSNAIMNKNASVHHFCLINSGAILEHDCKMDSFSQLSPGSVVCGNCKIGKGSFIGANTTIIQNKKIGNWSVTGAGSLILENVDPFTLNFGSPSKKIRKIDSKYKVFTKY